MNGLQHSEKKHDKIIHVRDYSDVVPKDGKRFTMQEIENAKALKKENAQAFFDHMKKNGWDITSRAKDRLERFFDNSNFARIYKEHLNSKIVQSQNEETINL